MGVTGVHSSIGVLHPNEQGSRLRPRPPWHHHHHPCTPPPYILPPPLPPRRPPNRGPTHAMSKLTLNVHAITPREAGRAKRNRKKAKAKTCTPRYSAVVVSLVRFHLKCILCSVGFASGFFSCFDLWMFWHEEAGKREFFLGEALKRFRRVWRLSLRGQGHLKKRCREGGKKEGEAPGKRGGRCWDEKSRADWKEALFTFV